MLYKYSKIFEELLCTKVKNVSFVSYVHRTVESLNWFFLSFRHKSFLHYLLKQFDRD